MTTVTRQSIRHSYNCPYSNLPAESPLAHSPSPYQNKRGKKKKDVFDFTEVDDSTAAGGDENDSKKSDHTPGIRFMRIQEIDQTINFNQRNIGNEISMTVMEEDEEDEEVSKNEKIKGIEKGHRKQVNLEELVKNDEKSSEWFDSQI